MFTYIRPVKCNVHIINVRKSNEECFSLVIVKIPETNIIIPLWPSYYIPKNPQNTIIQTPLNHWNQFRSVRSEALRWLKITTDTVKKLKVEIKVKERDKNYYTSLPLMYLIFNNNNLQIRTSSLYPWLQSPIFLSINNPYNGN